MKQRILSILMTLCLCMTLLPAAVFAGEGGTITWTELSSADSFNGTAESGAPYRVTDGDNTTYYLPAGSYQLTDSFTLAGSLAVTGTVRLDLNGKTLTVDKGAQAGTEEAEGDLTVQDSGSGGTLTNNAAVRNSLPVLGVYKGSFTLKSGTIQSVTSSYALTVAATCTATLEGGAISAVADDNQNAIKLFGTLYANGGTVTGDVEIKSSSASIQHSSHAADTTVFKCSVWNGGASDAGGTISGGIFEGAVTNYATISGGTFHNTVTNASDHEGGAIPVVDDQGGTIINNGAFVFDDEGSRIKWDKNDAVAPTAGNIGSLGLQGTGYVEIQGWDDENLETTYSYFSNSGVPITDLTSKKVVTFDLNGGAGTIPPQGVYDNGTAARPAAPTRKGYTFTGWYREAGCATKYDFNAAVEENITLYAGWKKKAASASQPSCGVTAEETVNGRITLDRATVPQGGRVTITAEPEAGYRVGSVTAVDKNGNAVPVTKEGTGVYSAAVPSGGLTVAATFVPTVRFADVPAGRYFTDAVRWAAENGIVGGTDETHFSPYASCTRGQLVTFLWRAAGEPEPKTAANPFADVKETSAFCKAILWASENGIVGGYGDGLFGTGDNITRQQVAAILYRYAKFAGMDTTQGGMLLREFRDYESVSAYALSAVGWAVNTGVLTGNDGSLLPHDTCTRAQIVTMLYRLLAE